MNEIAGMKEAFEEAKVVFLITFRNGEEKSRPMTNFNSNPYETFWFPTYRDTKKVEDINEQNKVLVKFPADKEGEFYEIEGIAEFADRAFVSNNWQWWYLYWHPHQRRRFWFSKEGEHPDRMIILIQPENARKVLEK
jgi:general stress protein 26